jgi:hypothetical protein
MFLLFPVHSASLRTVTKALRIFKSNAELKHNPEPPSTGKETNTTIRLSQRRPTNKSVLRLLLEPFQVYRLFSSPVCLMVRSLGAHELVVLLFA